MKVIKYSILILLILTTIEVKATSGNIRQNSVIECSGVYYGNHGSPIHWHIVEKRNDKWVSISGEKEVPSCYLKPVNTKEEVQFSKCIDGDTAEFIIQREAKTVRFLAIDTPEIAHSKNEVDEPMGKEASDFTCNALRNSNNIYLEYDGNSDKEDKYGRILAFVHVDDELLEAKLIENGYAKVAYIYGDYAYVEELRELETKAKEDKKGMWIDTLPDISDTSDTSETDSISDSLYKILKFIIEYFLKIFDLI